ncbi:MAG: YggS family pyridoxal phosphate-dependent enzyme [Rhodothermales bacterium]|nr:YggS family pyridoxal phosphate-dependent enzyme [Rhodothermales bacterium]
MNEYTMTNRSTDIRRNVEVLFERVRLACERAGRDSREVTVVAVSKNFSLGDIRFAFEAGVRHFGENRVQELVQKVDLWSDRYPNGVPVWHMVGHLQRNKAKEIIGRCGLFHALDSERLAEALSARAESKETVVPCLVQVNVSGEDSKFGFSPDEAVQAASALAQYGGMKVRGLMTLAHPSTDPEAVRPEFAKLRDLFERIRSVLGAQFHVLSMGMSGDFEVAIEEGATHIRVGTAIFGERQ